MSTTGDTVTISVLHNVPGASSQQVEITVKGLCADCPQEKKRRTARAR